MTEKYFSSVIKEFGEFTGAYTTGVVPGICNSEGESSRLSRAFHESFPIRDGESFLLMALFSLPRAM